MNLSRRYLSRFLPSSFKRISTDRLVKILDNMGLPVASVKPVFQSAALNDVVLAKVLAWQKHPNADRLRTCRVSIGAETLPIVCGASNFDVGDVISLAKVGAVLPNGMEMKAAKIRGETSHGMICSVSELGLEGFKDEGIWNISKDFDGKKDFSKHLGKPIANALGLKDEVIEIEITPNRGDCVSYLGVARELRAALGLELNDPYQMPEPKVQTISQSKMPFKIEASPSSVPTFLLQVWKTPWERTSVTPFELRWLLMLHGMPSIHPLVDMGNLVMLECGQPLHVYDVNKVEGKLNVRAARKGEKGQTLLGEPLVTKGQEVVIADQKRLLCVGGVIGMQEAAVDENTEHYWVEAAHFQPLSIRKTASQFGINTDSSYRFERGIDPTLPARALKRFAAYVNQYYGVTEAPKIVALRKQKPKVRTLKVNADEISNLVRGPTQKEMRTTLTKLGFGITGSGKAWTVKVPPHRFDVEEGACDLAEEVARLYGYERFEDDRMIRVAVEKPTLSRAVSKWKRLFRVADRLVACGYQETIHVGFLSKDTWQEDLSHFVKHHEWIPLANPINKERDHMPPMVFPLLLERYLYLRDRQVPVVKLFEMAQSFKKGSKKNQIVETKKLTMLMSTSQQFGQSEYTNAVWDPKHLVQNAEILQFNKDVVSALEELGISGDEVSFKANMHPENGKGNLFHPLLYQEVLLGADRVGFAAQVHPNHTLMKRGKSLKCFVAEIDMDQVLQYSVKPKSIQVPSPYPVVARDVSMRLQHELSISDLYRGFKEFMPNNCNSIQLMDYFVEEDQSISLTFRMFYENPERTLSDEEVNKWQEEFRVSLMKHLPIQYK